MIYELTYKTYGERSILIEWPMAIDEHILSDILRFKEKIKNRSIEELVEVRSAYNSLLVVYNYEFLSFNDVVYNLKELYSEINQHSKSKRKQWKIPVCYDDVFGIDLEEMALEKGLTKEAIITLYSKAVYTVYFIGFLPGFMYLGGLDKKLHTPRKATPRLKIDKGAVAIGGEQTGVYPSESPGGWNIIGNSPIDFFNPKNKAPCFVNAGDTITFKPVSLKTYNDIKTLVDAGVYQIESEVIDG
ncbi:5-oxoprolinase subunit PxpB [Flavivirga eckloniae]|uniref:Allophanate hydrolase subunit 1 n=1 Tax=Flavivirga eckloniae TaxID=1803846 RepID=A0A2K9PKI8_9FLAO|nr:5-oxoprolinase subunit PxpB [Flavivirga eckloniae]AUP77581.1 allophanate hydrolase subunit 1 [Flavivirga eckloniae]